MLLARKFVVYTVTASLSAFILANSACLCLPAQSTPSKVVQPKAVHIVAQVRRLTGDPLPGLHPKDFRMYSASAPLGVEMKISKDLTPPSVLIVLSSASGYDSLASAANYLSIKFPPAIQSRYRMSILGPQSEYIALQPARDTLRILKSGPAPYAVYAQAISDLGKSKGPRSIIFMTNKLTGPPDWLTKGAQMIEALIYAVGGDEDSNYIYSEGSRGSTGIPASAMASPGAATSHISGAPTGEDGGAEKSIRQVYAESNMQKAFRQMANVARGRYRLTVHIPETVHAIELRPNISGEYQIDAYAYLGNGDPPPALIVTTPTAKASNR